MLPVGLALYPLWQGAQLGLLCPSHQRFSRSREAFLAQKRVAMVAASRDPGTSASRLVHELSRRAYDVVPGKLRMQPA
jgi:hypothetical protein